MPISTSDDDVIRDQVISKIHWGARDDEVFDWLEEKKGIIGERAERLVDLAWKERRKQIRIRALVMMVISGIGALMYIGFIWLSTSDQFVIAGFRLILFHSVGGLCFAAFFRSLSRFVSGKTLGAVD